MLSYGSILFRIKHLRDKALDGQYDKNMAYTIARNTDRFMLILMIFVNVSFMLIFFTVYLVQQ